ncbi:lipid kinase [Microbaculum marinisediminis]|uniref:Lipid kinase n=1 Tax=Microbaculum marinisediminis TaxID=2931392 RepID=A0AAW5QWU2_9HYPH|nr:lipid kinase [Microbaculum sp. A6E488]MCT8971470.1 lipid kinase [Microbaculum sp. A6E488]
MPNRLLIVANPGASRADVALGPAVGTLAAAGFDLDLRQPDDANDIPALIEQEAPGCDAIVVAGGDGTVNAAAEALIHAGKPVGLLPVGTANDLAQTLGIPADPQAAADIIIAGHSRDIDVGRVNAKPFLNVASIGLSVDIARRQDTGRKQQWRAFSYLLTTIEVLGEANRFRAEIECDDESVVVDTYQIAVGNGVFYGGGMRIAEDAAIDDGLLDVYAIKAATVLELLALAPALRAGRHLERDDVVSLRGARVRIASTQPLPINTDGEVTTESPAEFGVDRAALTVFAPPPDP